MLCMSCLVENLGPREILGPLFLENYRWWFQIFFIFTHKLGEDEPNWTVRIFFRWVGEFNHQLWELWTWTRVTPGDTDTISHVLGHTFCWVNSFIHLQTGGEFGRCQIGKKSLKNRNFSSPWVVQVAGII